MWYHIARSSTINRDQTQILRWPQNIFLSKQTKEFSPKASLRWREGLFGEAEGGQEAFAISGKVLINFEEFLWEKTPRAQFTNYSSAQRTTKSRLISQDNEEPRESEGERERKKLMRWITCQ